MEGREFQLPPSREKEKLPLPAGEFHSFGGFFSRKVSGASPPLPPPRFFLRIPGTTRGWSLWNDGKGRQGIFPAWNCCSRTLRRLRHSRCRSHGFVFPPESGRRPGKAWGEDFCGCAWDLRGFLWDFGMGWAFLGCRCGIPGSGKDSWRPKCFSRCFPGVFPPPFPSFFPSCCRGVGGPGAAATKSLGFTYSSQNSWHVISREKATCGKREEEEEDVERALGAGIASRRIIPGVLGG